MIARLALLTCAAAALTLSACKENTPNTDTSKKDSASTTSAAAPITINSDSGRYTIQIPGEFGQRQEQQVPIQTVVGPVTMSMTLAQSSDGNNAVMVAYCDYPKEIFSQIKGDKNVAINAMFDSARAGGLRNVQNSKLVSETPANLNGMPGRSIVFSGETQGKAIHARFDYYIDVPRLYQVGYITVDSASLGSPSIQQMFSSLKVASASAPAADTAAKK